MFERPRRKVPLLNTASTADISFMLLILFLVTASMDTDKGLQRQLPPPPDEQHQQDLLVKERNVLSIVLDADDRLTCNGDTLTADALTARVASFVANEHNDPALPEKSTREVNLLGRCQVSDRHVLYIQADRATTYDAYFQMQNAIVAAYNQLRDQLARQRFGHGLAQCSAQQRGAVMMVYPQRISECNISQPQPGEPQKGGDRQP